MGAFWARIRPCLICTHEFACHVPWLLVAANFSYAFFLWEAACYEYCLVSHDVSIYCMLDLVDPHGIHYELPFRSRYCILDIVLLELVLFNYILLPLFLLRCFFIAGRICINDVTQQCHITRVCLRPLTLFGILVILFFILDYSSTTVLSIFFWSFLSLWKLLGSSLCMLIAVNLELSSLVLRTSLILLFL